MYRSLRFNFLDPPRDVFDLDEKVPVHRISEEKKKKEFRSRSVWPQAARSARLRSYGSAKGLPVARRCSFFNDYAIRERKG